MAIVEDSCSEEEHSSSAVVESSSSVKVNPFRWNLDSGTTASMTPHQNMLLPQSIHSSVSTIRLANGSKISATHSGSSPLFRRGHQALLVPSLQEPLLSISAVCDDGMAVLFTKSQALFMHPNQVSVDGPPVSVAGREGNLYYLEAAEVTAECSFSAQRSSADNSLLSWHRRLAHPNLRVLKQILKRHGITPSPSEDSDVVKCEICIRGKMHRSRFGSRSEHRAKGVGDIIHSDLASFPVQSREGFKYYVSFVDDYSKVSLAYLLKSKSQTFSAFKHFRAFFENHTKAQIKCFRSDNGGEFISKEFGDHLASNGISFIPGPPHTPQLNGVAERLNRTVGERVRCLLLSAGLPDFFWADALRLIFYLWNSIPCSTAEGMKAPNEVAHLPVLRLADIHSFGCRTWYKVPEAERTKLSPKAREAILLSFLSHGNGYVLWDLGKRKVVKSRDVIFDDSVYPYQSYNSSGQPTLAGLPVDFPVSPDDNLDSMDPSSDP